MTRHFLTLAVAACASPAFGQGYPPAEAVKRMKLPPGFTATAVATEPMIRQPLSISFDARGRLWVLQYLQYPNPAGLTAVSRDQYLRTVWDKVPDPPPKGPKGADRLTVCYDPDEQGVFRKSKDFVAGLNLASGFCIGNGGVYVVQPPYLLFYPDKNDDDIPDGDPDVLLAGFGMDDTHSLANSLQWGPDGWLYGAAGSTSTCKIRNPAGKPTDPPVEFQQGIWRYHPPTKRFELFSEGGGNTYGLDFDRHGQAIAGTNWGGFAMLHQVQGAYYVKGFAKHGPLHNPHAYGYFDHVPYTNFKGGHVTCGGVVYQGGAYPKEYDDQYIAGNLLSNAVYWHKLIPDRDTFKATHGGDFLVSNDDWCRPVDLTIGPDGCVYVADWYDKRAAHLDPIDNWDKTNGRVYRISYNGTPVAKPFDLRAKTRAELVELLKHPNVWWRREARQLIAERCDESLSVNLQNLAEREKGDLALESLWALAAAGRTNESSLLTYLDHPNEHVRSWAVRLIGDDGRASKATRDRLSRMAVSSEGHIARTQLACTYRRLPFDTATDLVGKHILTSDKTAGVLQPLLCWWALERVAVNDPNAAVVIVGASTGLGDSTTLTFLIERLSRRLLGPDISGGRDALRKLMLSFQGQPWMDAVIHGMVVGTDGGTIRELDPGIVELLREATSDERHILLGRVGDSRTLLEFRRTARNTSAKLPDRVRALELLKQVKDRRLAEIATELLTEPNPDTLLIAALAALEAADDPATADLILGRYSKLSPVARRRAISTLLARKSTTVALFTAVSGNRIPPTDLSLDQVRTAAAYNDPAISRVIEKHFGKVGPATPGEKQARISWLDVALSRATGDPVAGKPIFTKQCATCHKLHGDGNAIGPDLTTADRKNRRLLLTNVVDPSLSVRPEYIAHTVNLADGRKLVGLVAAADANAVTLLDAENRRTVISRADIESLNPSPVSLMPEKSLDTLTDQQVADLFAYLQSDPAKR